MPYSKVNLDKSPFCIDVPREKVPTETYSSKMENLDPCYVTGFCEGEGTFTYSRSGNNLNLYFAIKVNFEDRDLLYKMQSFFSVGRIYVGKPIPPRKYSGHTRTYFYYRVSKISELRRIIEHFDNYPLKGKKAVSFSIWKEMVKYKQMYRKPQYDRLNELANKLSAVAGKRRIAKA